MIHPEDEADELPQMRRTRRRLVMKTAGIVIAAVVVLVGAVALGNVIADRTTTSLHHPRPRPYKPPRPKRPLRLRPHQPAAFLPPPSMGSHAATNGSRR